MWAGCKPETNLSRVVVSWYLPTWLSYDWYIFNKRQVSNSLVSVQHVLRLGSVRVYILFCHWSCNIAMAEWHNIFFIFFAGKEAARIKPASARECLGEQTRSTPCPQWLNKYTKKNLSLCYFPNEILLAPNIRHTVSHSFCKTWENGAIQLNSIRAASGLRFPEKLFFKWINNLSTNWNDGRRMKQTTNCVNIQYILHVGFFGFDTWSEKQSQNIWIGKSTHVSLLATHRS